jgi:signal transduction histidine kinase
MQAPACDFVMSKFILRIVALLLAPCLILGQVDAAFFPLVELQAASTFPQEVIAVQALSPPANVFLHPRSMTARAGVVFASLAIGSIMVYESIQHPKPVFLFLNALALIFSTILAKGPPQKDPNTNHAFSQIRGIPAEGPAQSGEKAEWNDVGKWANAIVSHDGTKLAVAARGISSGFLSIEDVAYIVEYNRDPQTGALSRGEVAWQVHPYGDTERLGTDLYYTSDNRLTFISVFTERGRVEIPRTEMTRDDFKGIYRIYQRSVPPVATSWIDEAFGPKKGEIQVTDEMVGYGDISVWLKSWVPRISPTNDRALMPVVRWKEPERTVSKDFLIEVPIDLEHGQWNDKDWQIILGDGEEIPGSLHHLLRLSRGERSGAQYNYAKNGRSILLAQDGHFYEIKSTEASGQLVRGSLAGRRLSHLFSPSARHRPSAPKDIISLVDHWLVDLFGLGRWGWAVGKPITEAIARLLTHTYHAPIPLENYQGEYRSRINEALEAYKHHKNAARVGKPLPADKIRIIPFSKDNPLPDLPWHALVYVDGDTVVLHEAFLRWLETDTTSRGQFVEFLTDVLGHENVERPFPGIWVGTHRYARDLFMWSGLVEDDLARDPAIQNILGEQKDSQEVTAPLLHLNEEVALRTMQWEDTAKRKGIALRLSITPDDIWIQQARGFGMMPIGSEVISEAVLNALKYTPSGGSVDVILRHEGPDAILEVRDTGIGLTAEEQQRMWAKNYRGVRAQATGETGDGLGMTNLRITAMDNHGQVAIHSEGPEKGTTLTVRFPFSRMEPQAPTPAPATDLPSWFDAWLDQIGGRTGFDRPWSKAVGNSFDDVVRRKLVEDKSRYWFFVDEEKKTVRMMQRTDSDGWLERDIQFVEGQARPTVSPNKPWNTAERVALERVLTAWGSLIHGTEAFQAYPNSFLTYGREMENKEGTPEGRDIGHELRELRNPLIAHARDAVDSIVRTRTLPINAVTEWNDELQALPPRLAEVLPKFQSLDQPAPEYRIEAKKCLQEVFDMYEALAALASGICPVKISSVQSTLDLLRKRMEVSWAVKPDRSLQWAVSPEVLEASFMGTPYILGLLLENIANNAGSWAIKTISGNPPLIAFSAVRQADHIVFIIKDNGPGGADPATWSEPILGASKREGFGVGLPTIRYLANILGASVEVQSPSGQGTTVTIRLPIKLAESITDTKIPVPPHWNPAWPPPSTEELSAADEVLDDLLSHIESRGHISDSDFPSLGRYEDVSLSRILRAIYYQHPDLAAALVVGFGHGSHGDWARILSPWDEPGEPPTLEADLVGSMVSRGLEIYDEFTSPHSSGGIFIKGAPKYRGKEFSVRYDLEGIAGEMAYLHPSRRVAIFAHVEDSRLPKLIDAVIKFIEYRSDAWPHLAQSARQALKEIGPERLKRIEGQLSPETRHYLAHIDAIVVPSVPLPPRVEAPISRVAGRAVGKLIIVHERTPDLYALSHLPQDAIVAMEFLPTSDSRVGPFRGILTFRQDGQTSHAEKRAEFWDVPHALWPGPEMLIPLEGKYVTLDVSAESVNLHESTQEELINAQADQAASLLRPRIEIPKANLQSPRFFLGRGDSLLRSPEHVGHKVASLNQLARQPPKVRDRNVRVKLATGMALPFSAFAYALKESDQEQAYENAMRDLGGWRGEYSLEELRSLIQKKVRIPHKMWSQMSEDKTDWQAMMRGVFVRTSTNAEDLPDFPGFGSGIYKTVPNAKGEHQLDAAIKAAWASIWGDEAYWERDKFGVYNRGIYPAIWLVPSQLADYSFVIHTSNVALKRPDQLIIEIVQGLGESLVGNDPMFAGFPSRVEWNKRVGKVMDATPSTKQHRSVLATGGGTLIEETDPTKEFLNHTDVRRLIEALAEIGEQTEKFFGRAQDIEGVLTCTNIQKGQWTITLLQTRNEGNKPSILPDESSGNTAPEHGTDPVGQAGSSNKPHDLIHESKPGQRNLMLGAA